MKNWLILFALLGALPTATFAAGKKGGKGAGQSAASATILLKPDALGTKALLEDLLARRFGQELQTIVDRQSFTLGAQLDLTEIPPEAPPKLATPTEEPPLNDLMLGSIDPEELIKKYAPTEERTTVQSFLKNYRIKAVNISVGLNEDLGADVKSQVDKWLQGRLTSEFGKGGKGSVSFIKMPIPKRKDEPPPRSVMELLNQFQSLFGQVVLAVAILLGILLWQIMAKPQSTATAGGDTQNINLSTGAGAGESADSKEEKRIREETEEKDRLNAALEIDQLTTRLVGLVPRLSVEFEAVIRAWCQMGDGGKLRLACFAEAVGREVGKLPIPIDAMADVGKIFANMTQVTLPQKRDALQKAYWDLLTTINVGSEALNQPFGYLGGLNVNAINQVLMDQNPKMKTLVSLYLPQDLRERYLKSLSAEVKSELLQSAASLSEIGADELRSLDGSIAGRLKPNDTRATVPLGMTLNKIVPALSPIEEVTLLGSIKGAGIEEFKRQTPSLAFVGEWAPAALSLLMSRAGSDEVTVLLRVRPDLKERVLAACPPLTAEMATDELNRKDTTSDNEKNLTLTALVERLRRMVQGQEIRLEELFVSSDNNSNELRPAA